ncbi:MAG TPA: Tad domain-containing protein [Candidatus Melainabacteria bacterium]|nr:Tad domain-containing protein [Candidatus Melainabacteria bacterium]
MSRVGNHKMRFERSARGALGSLLFLLGIFITLLFAVIAVDIAHFVSANAEMQCAADAAAMMGCYDLQWNSTASNMTNATADARYMATKSFADYYNPTGMSIPADSVNVTFSSLNGGTNNAITVTMNPPIVFLFAPFIGNFNRLVGVSATAERLPISTAPAPPWFLGTDFQIGPDPQKKPSTLPSPSPAPPTTFPTNAYITFIDSSKLKQPGVKTEPPILPTYWVDMGLSDLSNAKPNPPGVAGVLKCMGQCVTSTACNTTNPVVINGSQIIANHGAYNSNVSNPDSNSADWTNGKNVILPVTTNGDVISVYVVKLTGPYVPNSFTNGQGVFGEFGVQFVGSADNIPGVTVMSPTNGAVYQNVGATVAALVK